MTNDYPKAWQDRARELYPKKILYEYDRANDDYIVFDGGESNRQAYLRGLSESKPWVGVEKELPKDGQIIDTWNGIANRRAEYSTRSTPCKFRRHVYITEGDRLMLPYYPDVTHWMPLPSPPASQPLTKEDEKK